MTDDQFSALVSRLESIERRSPRLYRFKVYALACLGNLYLGCCLLFLIAGVVAVVVAVLSASLVFFQLAFVLAAVIWTLVKALFVKVDSPRGTEVLARRAPELFSLIERLRVQLGAPRFHHVLITPSFNASVVQEPRFGLFGPSRNYLLLGLPLLKALDVDQLSAVVAHEFGHLAKGHGRMARWVYRQRLRWASLLAAIERESSWGEWLFKPFMKWFVPYFNAYSFPLARANEFQADAIAGRLTSPAVMAQALTLTAVTGAYLDQRFWPGVHKRADIEPQPGFLPFGQLQEIMSVDLDAESTARWIDDALAQKTDCSDTHPSLTDRLAALGESVQLVISPIENRADRLLMPALETLTDIFDAEWKEAVSSSWMDRYQTVQKQRRRLDELEGRLTESVPLSLDEKIERGLLIEALSDEPDEVLANFKILHEQHGGEPPVCLLLGTRLLWRSDEAGLPLVELAMKLDARLSCEACVAIRDYHARAGRMDEATLWHQHLLEHARAREEAEAERRYLRPRERLEEHGLPEQTAQAIRAALVKIPNLRAAWFVKKPVKRFLDQPCYLIGFRVTHWNALHDEGRAAVVAIRIQEAVSEFKGLDIRVINIEGGNRKFAGAFKRLKVGRLV